MASRTKKPVKTARTPAKRTAKPKTSAKAVAVKKRPVKKAAAKPVRKPAPKPRKETLASLRAFVDDIELRLSKADKATKASITALKSSYTRLSKKTGSSQDRDGLLSSQLDALSERLTGMIEKTRDDVAHDLQIVLDDPRMETVSAALTKANHRITTAEREQTHSIAAINEQISTLAAIVDDRLQAETREREKLVQSLNTKIDSVEKRSATAVRTIGDKVVTLTTELNTRAEVRVEEIKQDLSEQSVQQLKELEEHKSEISRRIEALEDDQRNTIPSLERRLVTMTSRLEALESEHFAAVEAAQYAPPAFAPMPQSEVHSPNVTAPVNIDAFSPQQAVAYETVMPPPDQPQMQQPAPTLAEPDQKPEEEAHIPQEYVPQEYVSPTAGQGDYAQPFNPNDYRASDVPEQVPEADQLPVQQDLNYYTPVAETPLQPDGQALPPPFENTPPPIMPLPEQTMDAARPGGAQTPKEKRGLFSLIKGGGGSSPVKLFALMTGVAVIGLFAAQKVLAPDNSAVDDRRQQIASTQPVDPVQIASNSDEQPLFESTEPIPPVIESMDVVGDYSDAMQAPELEPEANGAPSAQQLTLETAATKGDKIAQFQMGLSHLEAGRNTDAVRLIRLSANQGQAAAQYRLAKLYENGIGVEKDPSTAMKLLERSAKGGNRIAMHDLGHYYATAVAADQPNIAKAVEWFQKAAERGVLDSQFNLGVLYQEGSGVTKSLVDAYVWYAIAGKQGDKMAAQRSEIIARDLSEADLERATSRVQAFTPARINDAANGIFRDLPWAPKAKAATNRANPDVKTAQERLADLGYEVGTPDGAMGPKTRNAIITFERANGLPETGRVNAELIERLDLAAGA